MRITQKSSMCFLLKFTKRRYLTLFHYFKFLDILIYFFFFFGMCLLCLLMSVCLSVFLSFMSVYFCCLFFLFVKSSSDLVNNNNTVVFFPGWPVQFKCQIPLLQVMCCALPCVCMPGPAMNQCLVKFCLLFMDLIFFFFYI